jgi:hypothetical protein
MTMQVIDTLMAGLAGHAQPAGEAFRDLAVRLADAQPGEEVDAAEAAAVLREAGKGAEDLRQAAALVVQRRGWREAAAGAAGAEAELRLVEAEAAKAKAALDEQRARYEFQARQLQARAAAAAAAEAAASEAERELRRTAPPELLDRRRHLEAARAGLARKAAEARRAVESAETQAAAMRARDEREFGRSGTRDFYKDEIAVADARLTRAKAEAGRLREQDARLAAELEALAAELLLAD